MSFPKHAINETCAPRGKFTLATQSLATPSNCFRTLSSSNGDMWLSENQRASPRKHPRLETNKGADTFAQNAILVRVKRICSICSPIIPIWLQLFLLVSKLRSTLGADGGLLATLCHGSLNSCLASLDDGIACLMADRGTAVRIYAGPRRYSKITSSKMYSITSSNITSSEITAVKITTVRILGDRKETPRRCPKRAVCMQSNRFQNEPLCLSPYASWHRVIES